jgi:pimeloyl-ACP methyl ester carboxylesterase
MPDPRGDEAIGLVEGQGVTFLHGAAGRGEVWQLQALAFPQARTPDFRGRKGPGTPRTVAGHVAAVREVLNSAAVLVGHSLGGAVALQYAIESASRPRGLILVATGARLDLKREWLRRLDDDPEGVIGELVEQFFAPATSGRLKRKTLAVMRSLSPEVLRADLQAADGFDVRDRLGGLLVPTLIICGTLDRVTPPRYSEFLHSHLPRAELTLIEEAGHMVMLEQPRAVNDAIRIFLRKLEES